VTDTSPAAVAQMIAADIADTMRAVAAERDALAIEVEILSSHIEGVAKDTHRITSRLTAEHAALAAALVIMGINPASVIAAVAKIIEGAQDGRLPLGQA